ncbi:MAG TPA: hypothetical protein VHT97_00525 [Acidimicrobiales bacterium]|jgi:hypothetical protein|nr:hypothetical protein [Acidimicrobiales bacterium]
MPEIDPRTHRPLSDAPGGPDDQRGGREPGDPNLTDASENGGTAKPEGEVGDTWAVLPGEKPSEGGES